MFKFLRKTSLYLLAIPLLVTALGIVSNQAVLWANNDKFPVKWNDFKVNAYAYKLAKIAADEADPRQEEAEFRLAALKAEGFIDDTHVVMTPKTHLNWLADIWDFHAVTYSIGDFALYLGDWLFAMAPIAWFCTVIGKLNRT